MQLHEETPKHFFELYPHPKNSPLGSQKVKADPKIRSKSKVRIIGTIEKKLFIYMSRPKTVFEPYSDPKNSPLGPQKDPKINSQYKVRIEGTIENKRYSTT